MPERLNSRLPPHRVGADSARGESLTGLGQATWICGCAQLSDPRGRPVPRPILEFGLAGGSRFPLSAQRWFWP